MQSRKAELQSNFKLSSDRLLQISEDWKSLLSFIACGYFLTRQTEEEESLSCVWCCVALIIKMLLEKKEKEGVKKSMHFQLVFDFSFKVTVIFQGHNMEQ